VKERRNEGKKLERKERKNEGRKKEENNNGN